MNDLADRKRDIKIYPFRYPAESIQDYVKRLLTRMYERGDLPKEEIERLQNLDYSKIMFGINYPLLITDYNDIFDLYGHARYWINFKLAEKYYVCSQWWKDHERQYNYNHRPMGSAHFRQRDAHSGNAKDPVFGGRELGQASAIWRRKSDRNPRALV